MSSSRLGPSSLRPLRTVYRSLHLSEAPSSRFSRISPAHHNYPRVSRNRSFATRRKDPEQNAENKNAANSRPGKPAPGFEELYGQPPMNQSEQASTTKEGAAQSEAVTRCTPEEAKILDGIAGSMNPPMLKFLNMHQQLLTDYILACKYMATIPPEVRDIMPLYTKGELFNIRNAPKLMKVAERAVEHHQSQEAAVSRAQKSSQEESVESRTEKEPTKCTPEEEKSLDEAIKSIKQIFPQSLISDVVPFLESCKKKGIPPEVREILDVQKQGKLLSLSSVMKLVRLKGKVLDASGNGINESRQTDRNQSSKNEEGKAGDQGTGGSGGGSGGSGGPNGPNGPGGPGGFRLDLNTFIVSLFTTYILYKIIAPSEASKDITWQEFNSAFLQKGLVEQLVVVNDQRVKVFLHKEALRSQHPDSPAVNDHFFYYFTIGSVEGFEKRIEAAQDELRIPPGERIPISYVRGDSSTLANLAIQLIPTALLLGGLYYLARRGGGGSGGSGGVFGMGRSKAKKFNHESDVKVKFADVAGMDEAKVEIMEFVSFLKQPERFQKLGAKIPRGAILSGPPGTGKTLLAKATAGESGVPFFSVSGAEFVEIFVGVGPSRVRDLFANARKSTPCIIFIDEIDAIGRSRGGKNQFSGGNDEREATLNQILTEMDGFNTSDQVVVLAGTNRPDILDSALMRPGRFDRHIAIDRPTMDGRKQIFKVHLKKIVTDEDMEKLTGRLAALTPGFSGADIANCANEAALIAARENADKVRMKHFEAAIERTIGGLEKKSLVLSPEEKRVVAYHEAGHAICGWFFKHADPLLKVSIIPRGQGALGYAQYLPGDTYLMNELQFMDRMAMTLGGRVSEELHFDTVTSGASDDFNKVTRMATAMVTKYGMSDKIGRVYYDDDNQQSLHKPFSEETAREIDVEVKRIADTAYKQCRDLLTAKKKEVGLVAEELLKKEMLVRDDLIRILGRRPFEDKGEFEKYFGGQAGQGQKSAPPPPPSETQPGDGSSFPGNAPPSPSPAMKRQDVE